MWLKNRQDRSYVGVALAFILVGSAIFAFGLVSWMVNIGAQQTIINEPSAKVIGGLVVTALGYIQLELGLIREK